MPLRNKQALLPLVRVIALTKVNLKRIFDRFVSAANVSHVTIPLSPASDGLSGPFSCRLVSSTMPFDGDVLGNSLILVQG